ncbi:MAG: HupE/UreJ family protein [Cocleimonas sp.]
MQKLQQLSLNRLNLFSLRLLTIACLISLFCVSFFVPSTANAHEIRPAIIDFTFEKNGFYQLTIQHNIEALLAEIGTAHDDTEESSNAKRYNELRKLSSEELNIEFEKFSPEFLQNIQLSFDRKIDALQILDIDIPEIGDTELARDSVINIAGIIPENIKNMSWKWDEKFGNAVLRISSESDPELFSSYLVNGNESEQVPINVDCYNAENAQKVGGCALKQTKWDTFTNYIKVGFVHIIPKGLDHILFVVGLFLLSAHLRPLLIQITTFTLAHSVTLALGIYGVVNVSAAIVEPLIAASIVYVCIENIYSNKLSRWRPFVIFGFGLLHGLGFASVLGEIGLVSGSFVTGLIAFNIGVELGQLAVIAVCFLLVGLWFRKKLWYRKFITIPASVVIALIAIYWVLERTGVI